jgi:hypothetical protein
MAKLDPCATTCLEDALIQPIKISQRDLVFMSALSTMQCSFFRNLGIMDQELKKQMNAFDYSEHAKRNLMTSV